MRANVMSSSTISNTAIAGVNQVSVVVDFNDHAPPVSGRRMVGGKMISTVSPSGAITPSTGGKPSQILGALIARCVSGLTADTCAAQVCGRYR